MLFAGLIKPNETIYVAWKDKGRLRQASMDIQSAIDWYTRNIHTPNLYYSPSVLLNNESTNYSRNAFSTVRGFCLDLDYGQEGHKAKTYFANEQEALCYLGSLPFQPAMIWNTGHGIQALYLLNQAIDLTHHEARDEWLEICSTIKSLSFSDTLPSPEHLFRIPETINAKPNCTAVTGRIIQHRNNNTVSLDTLRQLHRQYGIDDLIEQKKKSYRLLQPDSIAVKDLPPYARQAVMDPSTGDRSHDFFVAVLKLHTLGYSPSTILDAIQENADFLDKYQNRIEAETNRVLAKITKSPGVYYTSTADHTALVRDTTMVETHRLNECQEPDPDVAGMLNTYIATFGLDSTDALKNSLRFHEQLFNQKPTGVFETGCGYGKSTWALCRMASKANSTHPCIYIVETLKAVKHAYNTLTALNPTLDSGMYHGFDQQQCKALTGTAHSWQETIKGDHCICTTCAHQNQCSFFTRDQALKQPVTIMTHQGFLILAEQNKINSKANIIIDEDLQTMLSVDFTIKTLLDIDRWVQRTTGNAYRNLKKLLPGTLLEYYISRNIRDYDPTHNNPTFCGNHYSCFSPTTQTVKDGLSDIGYAISKSITSVPEHVWKFYFFFRSARTHPTDFVLFESQDSTGVPRLYLKKNRIGLSDIKANKLWVLNASAALNPNTYPDSMKIHRCVDLQPNSHRANLYLIEANPMRSKTKANIAATAALLEAHPEFQTHNDILLTLSKQDENPEAIIDQLKPALSKKASIKVINRGRLKGTNEASDRTLVILSCMSVFTTVNNCAMTLALNNHRTIPLGTIYHDHDHGAPRMNRGYFSVPDIQEIYACSALDELYQALYRSAIRRDQEVDVIMAVPHLEWLSALHRTVLPDFSLKAAYRWKDDQLETNPQVEGFCELLGMTSGETIRKLDAAVELGFRGKSAWKDNKDKIVFWLEPFFKMGNKVLIRK